MIYIDTCQKQVRFSPTNSEIHISPTSLFLSNQMSFDKNFRLAEPPHSILKKTTEVASNAKRFSFGNQMLANELPKEFFQNLLLNFRNPKLFAGIGIGFFLINYLFQYAYPLFVINYSPTFHQLHFAVLFVSNKTLIVKILIGAAVIVFTYMFLKVIFNI
ncbi:hypothetical protein TRFO_17671 [Tritrichomonas foetus]|uniref:Uncharacterized protein n=1 Tax=Tritrichomonas foetus TaxID=1144522 RepID=A0A1J4KRQ5_9EUKA|nr:hypothetical protein TRFO_17671 [Tritrichomonas foetus]|eukprot:OHT12500.1 hypothetical protein TRFO_17671 [Tritrichomonas foetus]